MKLEKLAGIVVVVTLVIAAVIIVMDRNDHQSSSTHDTDGAFITEMIPHHLNAITMAKIAQRKGQHAELKQLADAIVSAQNLEVGDLSAAHRRLFAQSFADAEHGSLGLDEHAMGMDMAPDMLENAKPFDRAFIDMMIPHHQGAIRMARIELAEGRDGELMTIAEAIIAAQTREINQMNAWRTKWYGSASPAGGASPVGEDAASGASHEMNGMDHGM